MEFRPGRRTLLINYLVTFAIVGWVLYSVRSPEQVKQNWYDPEYTSHMSGTYGELSCKDCHIQPFAAAEEKTCWTGGCHSHFDPTNPPVGMLLINQDEKGQAEANRGAQLAFHMQASEKMSCEACHPSHLLPTWGAFNKSTIQLALQAANLPPMTQKTAPVHRAKKLEIFHAGIRRFVPDANNCASCHIAPQNTIHVQAASQSCISCHSDVTSWKGVTPSAAQVSQLFEGHPPIPQAEEPPVLSRWVAGYRP